MVFYNIAGCVVPTFASIGKNHSFYRLTVLNELLESSRPVFHVKFNVTYAYLKDGFQSRVDYLAVFLRSAVVEISKRGSC